VFSYIAIMSVITLLGLATLREWLLRYKPTQKTIEKVHKTASQKIALGEYESALKDLSSLYKKGARDIETFLLYINILHKTNQTPAAFSMLQEAFALYPKSLNLHLEKGKILLSQENPSEALKALRKAKPILKEEDDFIYYATALLQTDNPHEAWPYLKKLSSNTKNGKVMALLGDSCFRMKNYRKAIFYYKQAQDLQWNNYRITSRLAQSLQCIGKYKEAEGFFLEILHKDPSDIPATLGYGACLEAHGKHEEALDIYQKGEAWDAGTPIILRQAGICATHIMHYDFAEIYLRESIQRGAQTPQALAFLGFCLEKLFRWEEAEEIYLRLVAEFPRHAAGYQALAWLYGVGLSISLDAEHGLSMAYKALKLLPNAISWEVLSACEARAGNFQKAHNIQEQLSSQEQDEDTLRRRRYAMRLLRKKQPLDAHQVDRALVA
jgi:tetratricopeptide (TPR) repeat protein